MKISVIAPCFYTKSSSIRYLMLSAARHGIYVNAYGFGDVYKGWIDTHITRCIDKLRSLDSTHVLFTDASDVVFVRGLQEITSRYLRLGHPPMLMSYEVMRGLNAGGWLGEREVAIAILEHLSTPQYTSGDPQERWREATRLARIRVEADSNQLIFNPEPEVPRDTCIAHFAGGYTSPETGKSEHIEPYWQSLGYGDSNAD